VFAIIALLSIVTTWTIVLQYPLKFQAQASFASLPPMTLTIIGANGTQVVIHETEIGNLPTYRAYGGYKNQLGYIRGLGYYTGVRFTTLCNLVGGMHVGNTLRVTASDSYAKNFTYSEVVVGDFVTYDPSTGNQVPHYQPLVPIMAYYYNDLNISESNGGPLRVAIVGPEGLVTNSTYWVKWSIKMEILGPSLADLSVATFGPHEINGVKIWIDSGHPIFYSPANTEVSIGWHTIKISYGFIESGPEEGSYIKYVFLCWDNGLTNNTRNLLITEDKATWAFYKWIIVYLW
jgi:hypothetical protein